LVSRRARRGIYSKEDGWNIKEGSGILLWRPRANPGETMKLFEKLCFRKDLGSHRKRLYRMAVAWCGDPMVADDLVQETLTRAVQKIDSLRDYNRLDCWLYSILNNCWREHLRRRKPTLALDEEQYVCDDCPESAHTSTQIVDRVRYAISQLPVGQRKVITLVDLEGCAYAEVAGILGVPIGTVMSRLSRARKQLQSTLADLYESEPRAPRLRRVK